MRESFIKGTIFLAAAGFLSRILGSVYRVVLPRLLGAEGVGIYQMAYYIYALALFIVTPGLPLAISRLVATAQSRNDWGSIRRVLWTSLSLLFFIGFILSFAVYYGAETIAGIFFNDVRVAFPLQAIAPAIFFVSLMALCRGFFQGTKRMLPTAASQVIEQLIRMLIMVGLVLFVLDGPVQGLAAGAALATVGGEMAGFIFIFGLFWRQWPLPRAKTKTSLSYSQCYRRILGHALPLSLGALAIPLVGAINAAIIPRRLQGLGLTAEAAAALYGQYSGMALVLFFFPLVITSALAIALVPAVAEAHAAGDYKTINRRLQRAVGLTIQTTVPSLVGFLVLGRQICGLLFGYPQAGVILAFMAPSLVFLGLQLTLAGALQGLGYIMLPVINLLIGTVCNGILTYILTGKLGIIGAGIGTGMGFTIAGVLNLVGTGRLVGLAIDGRKYVLLPLIGSALMGLLVYSFHLFFSVLGAGPLIHTLVPVGMGIIFYFLFLIVFKGIEPKDIELIPLIGGKINTWIH